MYTVNTIHIFLELWGTLFTSLCLAVLIMGRDFEARRTRILIELLISSLLLLLSDAAAWAYRSLPSELGFYAVRISNFLNFLSYDLCAAFMSLYIMETVKTNKHNFEKRWVYSVLTICSTSVALLILTQFNGFYYHFDASNTYIRSKYYWVSVLLGGMMIADLFIMTLHYRNKMNKSQFRPLMAYYLLPFIVMLFQLFNYGINLLNFATATAIIMLFMSYEVENVRLLAAQETQIVRQQLELAKLDKELSERNQQIILSQIQPHFLYNSLATISHLCRTDAVTAKHATDVFSDYLRTNLDSLKGSSIIPFASELKHTQTYLWLEELRFGEDLRVEYDIEVSDFEVPSLVLQPLAENAVKHGICRTYDGGTVRILTRKVEGGIEISVEDDGAGFDVNAVINDGRSHIGIENVRARIDAISGGTLTIESEPGKGTRSTIFIPAKE